MAYINPFTRDVREHNISIVENHNSPYPGGKAVGMSAYQYKVKCSCQWEVLCRDMGEAESWKWAHLHNHGQL